MKKIVFVLFILIGNISNGIEPKEYWMNKYAASLNNYYLQRWNLLSNQPYVQGANGNVHEDLGYGIESLIVAFEVTGNTNYLETALVYFENIIQQAHLLTDVEPGYIASLDFYGWYQTETDMTTGRSNDEAKLGKYVFKLARIILENSNTFNSSVVSRAVIVYRFFEYNIWKKWYDYGNCPYKLKNGLVYAACSWAHAALNIHYIRSNYALQIDPSISSNANALQTHNAHIANCE